MRSLPSLQGVRLARRGCAFMAGDWRHRDVGWALGSASRGPVRPGGTAGNGSGLKFADVPLK